MLSLLHLPGHLGASALEGEGGSRHAYSNFSVFIESSLINISQKPMIIIIRLQNANTLCVPRKHFGINTTKLPEGFISPKRPLHVKYGSLPVPFVKLSFSF